MKVLICKNQFDGLGIAINQRIFAELSDEYDAVVNEIIEADLHKGANERLCWIVVSAKKFVPFRQLLEKANLSFGDFEDFRLHQWTQFHRWWKRIDGEKIEIIVYEPAEIVSLAIKNTDAEIIYH